MTTRARPAQTSYTTSLQGPRQRDSALSKNSAVEAVTLSDDNAAKPSIRPESTTGQARTAPRHAQGPDSVTSAEYGPPLVRQLRPVVRLGTTFSETTGRISETRTRFSETAEWAAVYGCNSRGTT